MKPKYKIGEKVKVCLLPESNIQRFGTINHIIAHQKACFYTIWWMDTVLNSSVLLEVTKEEEEIYFL